MLCVYGHYKYVLSYSAVIINIYSLINIIVAILNFLVNINIEPPPVTPLPLSNLKDYTVTDHNSLIPT